MKEIRLLTNWLLTILIGVIFGCLYFVSENAPIEEAFFIGLVILLGSAFGSIPYIIIASIVMGKWSKKRLEKSKVHTNFFFLNGLITLLTLCCFQIFFLKGSNVELCIRSAFGYFAVNSILMHHSINKHYGEQFEENMISENSELLDDF